jgi:hypothetical protein
LLFIVHNSPPLCSSHVTASGLRNVWPCAQYSKEPARKLLWFSRQHVFFLIPLTTITI